MVNADLTNVGDQLADRVRILMEFVHIKLGILSYRPAILYVNDSIAIS